MKPDVLVYYPTRAPQMEMLEARYTLHRLDLAADPDALLAEVGPRCTAMVTNGHRVLDRALLAKLPNLKIAASSSAGYDTMDVAACTEHGVTITNTPDVLTDDVADIALLLLLATRRKLIIGDRWVRSGDWGRNGPLPLTSATAGKRVGIVGLGRIGRAIARRCEALRLEVGYTGRSRKTDTEHRFFPDLVDLARWSDILVIATTGGADTQALVGEAAIAALGPEGTLINIARGTVVDEPAMIAALQSGGLGAAGLDVYLNEPTPDPAFATMDNVVLYPHHASGTLETRDAMAQLVVDNLYAYFNGKPLLTPVN